MGNQWVFVLRLPVPSEPCSARGCSRCPAGRASSGDRGAGSPSCKPCGRGTFSDPGKFFARCLRPLRGFALALPCLQAPASASRWQRWVVKGGCSGVQRRSWLPGRTPRRRQVASEAFRWRSPGFRAEQSSPFCHVSRRGVLACRRSDDTRWFCLVPDEDRTYYVSLLEPKRFPGISLPFTNAAAFVWEVLPPRINNDGDACESSASSLSSLRPFAETLEQVVPNEGMPAGLWLNFAGSCERMGEVTKRELHILLSCRPEARRDNLDIKLLSAMRPPSPGKRHDSPE